MHRALLDRGFMLAPSAYEIGFISTAHDEGHIHGLADAMDDALSHMELTA